MVWSADVSPKVIVRGKQTRRGGFVGIPRPAARRARHRNWGPAGAGRGGATRI